MLLIKIWAGEQLLLALKDVSFVRTKGSYMYTIFCTLPYKHFLSVVLFGA